MYSIVVRGLLCTLLCLEAFGDTDMCEDKKRYKASLGKENTFNVLQWDFCSSLIRAPRGFHIRVKFTAPSYDKCCSRFAIRDASPPFRPERNRTLGFVELPSPKDIDMIFQTRFVRIEPLSEVVSANILVTYSAVIPEDGNCGYNGKAGEQQKTIRTPGYPAAIPRKNLRCTWNIRSSENQHILLSIEGLMTSSGQDYLDIYDDDQFITRYNGKLDKSLMEYTRRHLIFSGELRMHFRADTLITKGFKATYRAVDADDTKNLVQPPPRAEPGQNNGLLCHSRKIAIVLGGIMEYEQTVVRCPLGTLCGTWQLTTTAGFASGMNVSYTMDSCVPKMNCENPTSACAMLPKDMAKDMDTCAFTCCTSDLCNKGEASDLQCHQKSIVEVGDIGFGSEQLGYSCPIGNVCGLFTFSGETELLSTDRSKAKGYSARCVPPSYCNEDECKNLRDTRNVDVESCTAVCCSSDMCNRPPVILPDVTDATNATDAVSKPTAASVGMNTSSIQCYELLDIKGLPGSSAGAKSVKVCPEAFSCFTIKAEAKMSMSFAVMPVQIVFASCTPTVDCANLSCDHVTTMQQPDVQLDIEACDAACCNTDLCNDMEPSTLYQP